MIDVGDIDALRARIGHEVAVSDWIEISQERIRQFAEATEDRQWIHLDPARAAAESPYGTTIAHGFLTLSLTSELVRRTMDFGRVRHAINYGLNRVRFIGPVPAGSRVRARCAPLAVGEVADRGVQVTWKITLEREGVQKPCCVAEWIVRYFPKSEGPEVRKSGSP
jgi:acyl dehydratase